MIIPCLNEANTIATQLEALANQCWSEPWEVIISDNGSTDESMVIVERYRERLPNLYVVDSSDRRGAAHARNVGALAATGDALAFCDADDEVAPGWLAAMGEALSKYDFVACRIDIQKLNISWVQESRVNPQKDGLQKIWYLPYLQHAGGGTLGVKRSLHEAIGGFDESLPVLEDTDYCVRIQLSGAEFHFVPNAVVHVRYSDKLGHTYHQACLWSSYNGLLYRKYQRSSGMRIPQPWRRYAKHWKQLLRSLPQIRRKAGLFEWVWRFGWQVGKLRGSIKYRVPPV